MLTRGELRYLDHGCLVEQSISGVPPLFTPVGSAGVA